MKNVIAATLSLAIIFISIPRGTWSASSRTSCGSRLIDTLIEICGTDSLKRVRPLFHPIRKLHSRCKCSFSQLSFYKFALYRSKQQTFTDIDISQSISCPKLIYTIKIRKGRENYLYPIQIQIQPSSLSRVYNTDYPMSNNNGLVSYIDDIWWRYLQLLHCVA